jgi:hypothetical protein
MWTETDGSGIGIVNVDGNGGTMGPDGSGLAKDEAGLAPALPRRP